METTTKPKALRDIRRQLRLCDDCGAAPGQPHLDGCDVERCSICGGQRLQCECRGHDPLFARWTGFFPGDAEAQKATSRMKPPTITHLSALAAAINEELHLPKPSAAVLEKRSEEYRATANQLIHEMIRRHRAKHGLPRIPEVTL